MPDRRRRGELPHVGERTAGRSGAAGADGRGRRALGRYAAGNRSDGASGRRRRARWPPSRGCGDVIRPCGWTEGHRGERWNAALCVEIGRWTAVVCHESRHCGHPSATDPHECDPAAGARGEHLREWGRDRHEKGGGDPARARKPRRHVPLCRAQPHGAGGGAVRIQARRLRRTVDSGRLPPRGVLHEPPARRLPVRRARGEQRRHLERGRRDGLLRAAAVLPSDHLVQIDRSDAGADLRLRGISPAHPAGAQARTRARAYRRRADTRSAPREGTHREGEEGDRGSGGEAARAGPVQDALLCERLARIPHAAHDDRRPAGEHAHRRGRSVRIAAAGGADAPQRDAPHAAHQPAARPVEAGGWSDDPEGAPAGRCPVRRRYRPLLYGLRRAQGRGARLPLRSTGDSRLLRAGQAREGLLQSALERHQVHAGGRAN